jgi:hypothetical protein
MSGHFADSIVGVMVYCCSVPAAFILACTWLAYTTSPKARSKAHCCGNHIICANYSCDLTWDVLLVFFWIVMLAALGAGLYFFDESIQLIRQKVPFIFLLEKVTRQLAPADRAGVDSFTKEQYSVSLQTAEELSRATNIFLNHGKIVLIVAVVLAAVQLVSLVITAALSASVRTCLRGEACKEALPMCAPKDVIIDRHGVSAKPITGSTH